MNMSLLLSVFVGIVFSIFISFFYSLSERIEEAWFSSQRKSIKHKWGHIFRSRSQCSYCEKKLPAHFLIPLLGNFWAIKTCPQCKEHLGYRYFWSEFLAFGYGFFYSFFYIQNYQMENIFFLWQWQWQGQWQWQDQGQVSFYVLTLLLEIIFAGTLFHAARIDRKYMLVSHETLFVLFIAGVGKLFLHHFDKIVLTFIFAFVWYVSLLLIRKLYNNRFGLADIRLIYILTLAGGLPQGLIIPMVASMLAFGKYIWQKKIKKENFEKNHLFAFVPYLFWAWLLVTFISLAEKQLVFFF